MAAPESERRGHFRGKARPGRRIEVEISAGGTARRAHTRNIGVGGAFIVTTQPDPPGTQLGLLLRLPTALEPAAELTVKAEVRWTTPGEGDERPPGMGVKFQGLDVEGLLQLNEYFASLTGRE